MRLQLFLDTLSLPGNIYPQIQQTFSSPCWLTGRSVNGLTDQHLEIFRGACEEFVNSFGGKEKLFPVNNAYPYRKNLTKNGWQFGNPGVFMLSTASGLWFLSVYFSIAFNTANINLYLVLMLHWGAEGHKCVLALWSLRAFHLIILPTTLWPITLTIYIGSVFAASDMNDALSRVQYGQGTDKPSS